MTSSKAVSANVSHQVPDPRRLHEATDQLNTKLLDFEAALNELKLGVAASVRIDQDNQEEWEQYISFRKRGDTFKLFIDSGRSFDEDSWSETAIVSASREIRLKAVTHLPQLYERLLEA